MMLGIMPRIAPNLFVRNAASMLPQPDRALVAANPAFQQAFIRMVREALRQGSRGAHREALLTLTDWGFKLQQIQTALYMWHGEADQNIPVEMARHLAAAVPGCRAEFYPSEGHLSLFKKYAEHILGELTDPAA
jgi:pimeloyl-ACP methyl ester carboxylesterase